MKRFLLLTVFSLFGWAKTFAFDAYIDGIYYNFSGTEATVTHELSSYPYYTYYISYPKTIVIPKSVTYLGNTYSVTGIGENAFFKRSELYSITIPESVRTIGYGAFGYCSNLTSFTIPEGVTTIEDEAFWGCDNLYSITIPGSVTSIGSRSLIDTEWFRGQPDGLVYAGKVAYKYKGTMPKNTTIELKEGTIGISIYAFGGCIGLTSITIPESVTSIGDRAFKDCSDLTSISIPAGMTSIGDGAFSGCSSLTSITIPESLCKIGADAFKEVTLDNVFVANLSAWCKTEIGQNTWSGHLIVDGEEVLDLVIPEGVEEIGAYTFCGFSYIRSISFPNTVKNIGNRAFKACQSVKKLVITNGVESIGQEAFMNEGLTSIVIPNSVKNIGAKAFANNMELYSVTSLINTPFKLDSSVFEYDNSDYDPNTIYYSATLYVPRGRKSFYSMVDGWKTFLNIEENDMKYKLTYYLNNEEYKTYEIQACEVVTPEPDPVLIGCVFNGWNEIPRVMPAEDVIVKGTYTVNKYIIRYYVGEQLIAEDEVEYGAEIVLRDYTPEDAARYTFIGWEGEKYETMPAHDIEYHANIADGINGLMIGNLSGVQAIYDANGRRLSKAQRGVNILLMSDGTKRKVIVK